MPFNSLKYFFFLPSVYLAFYLAGERARMFVLLGASVLFYASFNAPHLLVILTLVAMTTYGFGIRLDQAESEGTKRTLLWVGVAANVLILIVMKYLPFLSSNLKTVSTLISLDMHIQPVKGFVSIGVSYYTFQAISYLFDIYYETEKPERHFGYFALYLAFFPKLLQGPIERAGDLIPQLRAKYEFDYENIRFGLLLFAWGLFKKVVIADRAALYADAVYNDVHAFTGLPLLLATYAYALQIYMDFSGYTDMALGSARLFNINLTNNFNSPYLATSVADFWRRWHITFSRWILDYIFKPLQMRWRNRKSWGTATALMVAFLASGVWHGANWKFVIWGGLHGMYMASSVFYRPYQKRLHKALGIEKTRLLRYWQIFVTFNLVSLAWIFFRANSFSDAWHILRNSVSFQGNFAYILNSGMRSFIDKYVFLGKGPVETVILVAMLAVNLCMAKYLAVNCRMPLLTRWVVYLSLFVLIVFFEEKSTSFIYFQF